MVQAGIHASQQEFHTSAATIVPPRLFYACVTPLLCNPPLFQSKYTQQRMNAIRYILLQITFVLGKGAKIKQKKTNKC